MALNNVERNIKILLITQGISRIVKPIFSTGHDVVGVLESMPRDYEERPNNPVLYRVLRVVYRLLRVKTDSLEMLCKKRSVPYNIIWNGNSAEVAQWVRSVNPDLVVVFGMSQLLGGEVINIPPLGVINLHPSYLPSYRGPNPDFWQYYYTDLYPGVTVHYIDKGEDTGDIIFQERLCMPLGSRSPEQLNRLIGQLGVSLLLRAIDSISSGSAPRLVQPDKSPTARARNLKLDEHKHLIDWSSWPVERVWHLLRGTEGWLNAIERPRGLFAGQRWSIDEFEKIENLCGQPGTLTNRKGRSCLLLKDGVIYLSIKFSLVKTVLHFVNK